ncbi:MAG TPA: pseudouridine synthase [Longimicrobiales bacterium]|jgi:pseudouridine synthase|nr:pseudouridine synthase [Longimicrobiales bacterium]
MADERGIRLQKFLAQAGVASRRSSEELITGGRVSINGRIATELGVRVQPSDDVRVDGKRIRSAPPQWFALHKPRGYMSTRSDPQGRRTLYDLVPPPMRRLFYVGRLDFDSEGLVLLTNDGDTAHRLLHPRYGIDREYDVELKEQVDDAALEALRRGVQLDDGRARAHTVRRKGGRRVVLTLREGRKREVRRMFAELGYEVMRLRRVRYGPIRLGDLPAGEYRALDARELESLRRVKRAGEDRE